MQDADFHVDHTDQKTQILVPREYFQMQEHLYNLLIYSTH